MASLSIPPKGRRHVFLSRNHVGRVDKLDVEVIVPDHVLLHHAHIVRMRVVRKNLRRGFWAVIVVKAAEA